MCKQPAMRAPASGFVGRTFPQGHQAGHLVFGQLDFLAAPLGQPVEFGRRTIHDFVRKLFRSHLRHGNLLRFHEQMLNLDCNWRGQ